MSHKHTCLQQTAKSVHKSVFPIYFSPGCTLRCIQINDFSCHFWYPIITTFYNCHHSWIPENMWVTISIWSSLFFTLVKADNKFLLYLMCLLKYSAFLNCHVGFTRQMNSLMFSYQTKIGLLIKPTEIFHTSPNIPNQLCWTLHEFHSLFRQ